MIAILMFTALAAASPSAPAEQPAPTPDVVVVAKDATPAKFNDMICRQILMTGSRLGSKKVCLTRAKWDDIAYGGRKWLESNQDFRTPEGN